MANGKGGGGGGPRIPRNLRPDLESANSVLQDMATRLSNLHEMSEFKFSAKVEGLDDVVRLENVVAKASRTNKLLAENLGARRKIEIELTKEMKKSSKQHHDVIRDLKRLNDLRKNSANLTTDEQKELKKLLDVEDDLIDTEEELAKKMDLLNSQSKKLSSAWVVLAKTVGSQVLKAIDSFGKALTSLAIDSVFFSLEKLRDGFLKIYDLMERTTKATGAFNLAVGGTTKGLDETRKQAWKVEGSLRALTGGPLGVGLQMWQETSQALGFVGGDFDEVATKATLAGRALGIGSSAAGEISRTFILMGDSSKDINHDMVQISDAANAAGVSVASFGKEVVSSKNFMATFGKVGRKVFLDSASFAKKLGVSLASLEKFTDMTDSFENTAKAAARMNIVFGTSVNAMELMLEQDPSKRLEMVRNELKAQGKTWEGLSRQERKFLADTLQVSAEEAAAVLNNKMTLDEFHKKQEKDKAKQVKDEKKIRDGLAKTAETLMNWGQQFDKITRSMMGIFEPILKVMGLTSEKMVDGKKKTKGFGELVNEVVGKISKLFNDLSQDKKFMSFIQDVADSMQKLFGIMTSDETIKNVKEVMSVASVGVKKLHDVGKKVVETVFTKKNLGYAMDAFKFLATNIDKIVGGFLAFKTVMGVGSVIVGLSSMSKLLFGTRGLVGLLVGFAKGLGGLVLKIIPMLASGFMKLATDIVPKLFSAMGGLKGLGAAAGVAGAAIAGWEIGKFIGNIDVAGKSINDWVVIGYEKIAEFGDKIWQAIKNSWFGKKFFGDEEQGAAPLQVSEQLRSLQSMKRTGQGDFFGTIGQLMENKAQIIEMSRGQITEADINKAIEARKAVIAASREASKVTPAGSGPGSATSVTSRSAPKNYASKTTAPAGGSSSMTLVAGDVYLDSNLVGRHLLRGVSK